jgi:hypothetical protein
MKTRELWVVLGVNAWEDWATLMKSENGDVLTLLNTPPAAGIGWMPVFVSEEEAATQHPNAPRIRILVNWDEDGLDA